MLHAIPVVFPFVAAPGDPVEFAVPKLLVPGAVGTLAELPAPLGSSTELLIPPALAGPDGTPFTPCVPAPADPAVGDPIALPIPTDGPVAAPVEPVPAEAPPAEPPPAPPPPLWAIAVTGINSATANNNVAVKCLCIISLLFGNNARPRKLVPTNRPRRQYKLAVLVPRFEE